MEAKGRVLRRIVLTRKVKGNQAATLSPQNQRPKAARNQPRQRSKRRVDVRKRNAKVRRRKTRRTTKRERAKEMTRSPSKGTVRR